MKIETKDRQERKIGDTFTTLKEPVYNRLIKNLVFLVNLFYKGYVEAAQEKLISDLYNG